jgi:signal transduction histidine kinase
MITEAHGGKICVASEEDKGTKLSFTLPCVFRPTAAGQR